MTDGDLSPPNSGGYSGNHPTTTEGAPNVCHVPGTEGLEVNLTNVNAVELLAAIGLPQEDNIPGGEELASEFLRRVESAMLNIANRYQRVRLQELAELAELAAAAACDTDDTVISWG